MGTNPTNADEGYFNDLSRQPTTSLSQIDSNSPNEQSNQSPTCDGDEIPKTKRIACVICRKRKLKCDGNRPKCSTCARLGHNCAYDEARRKSGPKRGYVKELEARLGNEFLSRWLLLSRLIQILSLQHRWKHNSRIRMGRKGMRDQAKDHKGPRSRMTFLNQYPRSMSLWTCNPTRRIRWVREPSDRSHPTIHLRYLQRALERT